MSTCVALVDDDPDILTFLAALMERESLAYKTYATGGAFLSQHDFSLGGCAVVDLVMPDISGLQVLTELNQRNCKLPIIVLTGYGDVPLAVEAMKNGAYDFLEKPIEQTKLLNAINRALNADADNRTHDAHADDAAKRLLSLSAREREVLKLIIEGNQTRAIATALNISVHTVDNHRAHIMRKMRTESLADLVRITCLYAGRAGFTWRVN